MAVKPGLCQTWLETPKTGFLTTRLINEHQKYQNYLTTCDLAYFEMMVYKRFSKILSKFLDDPGPHNGKIDSLCVVIVLRCVPELKRPYGIVLSNIFFVCSVLLKYKHNGSFDCSKDLSNLSHVVKKRLFAYAKTKTQTAKLISAFVFATQSVQSLYFLYRKFQASCHLLWLFSLVCVRPGRKPRRPVFSQRGSFFHNL